MDDTQGCNDGYGDEVTTEINARKTLAHAIAPHEEGTFLAIVRLVDSDGEPAVPAIEVVRHEGVGDMVAGDVDRFLKAMQLAMSYPIGGDLVICQVGESEWDAWVWNLLAGFALPLDAQQAQRFISEDLKFVTTPGGREVSIQCHNAYPIVLFS